MRITQTASGLISELDTTPWYVAITVGLTLVVVACVLFYLVGYFENSVKNNSGCLSVLLGFLGIVFALTGFTALFTGLFGGS